MICVEVLARGLPKAILEKGFQFHPKCVKLKLTHLDFNDDIVLFTREITLPFTLWGTPYKKFSSTSGLVANPEKSDIYFGGVAEEEQARILHSTGFSLGSLPFRYLELPLSSRRWKNPDKIRQKNGNWAAKKHSYSGSRTTPYKNPSSSCYQMVLLTFGLQFSLFLSGFCITFCLCVVNSCGLEVWIIKRLLLLAGKGLSSYSEWGSEFQRTACLEQSTRGKMTLENLDS